VYGAPAADDNLASSITVSFSTATMVTSSILMIDLFERHVLARDQERIPNQTFAAGESQNGGRFSFLNCAD
jgi:hypothetical protein